MPTCEKHKIFYGVACTECCHEARKAEKAEKKALEKHNKLIIKQKEKNSLPRKSVKKQSDKQKTKNQEYNERVKVWKVENPKCKARVNENCTGDTQDCHHQIGRGINLMNEKYWLSCCRNCHIFITNHPKEAMEKGWSFSRLEEREPHAI